MTDNLFTLVYWDGSSIIFWAAHYGYTEIVKVLVTLTNTPNAPNNYGDTPIHEAVKKGHTEIVKILIPVTENTNTYSKLLWTDSNFQSSTIWEKTNRNSQNIGPFDRQS